MSVVQEIKSKLDIVQYIQQYVPLKKAGRYHKACCPFHNEKTPSFVVNEDTQSWRCFGACAEGGDIFSFAEKMHGWTFSEALHELGNAAGIEVRKQTPQEQARDNHLDRLRGLLQTAAEVYHDHLLQEDAESAAVLAYTQQTRGFTLETITQFGIGYAPPGWQNMLDYLTTLGYSADEIIEVGLAVRNESGRIYDRFRNRLMIPIRDDRGRVVGFGARILDPDDTPKYLNSPQTPVFDKSRILFGLDTGKSDIRETETVVIVEGYMDAIQAHQAGFKNVVAQMGTAMTETQLKLVAPRYATKIILALDADAAGQNATRRSLEVARETLQADYAGRLSVDIRILQIPGAKDPDDFLRETPEQWPELVKKAMPVADYVIDSEVVALGDIDSVSIQEREAAARRILPMLLASESNLYRQDNLQKLAMRLRIAERDLLAWASVQPKPLRVVPRPQPPAPDVSLLPNIHVQPPPDYDDDDVVVIPDEAFKPVRNLTGLPQGRTSEALSAETECLRLLFQSPELMYQVNRKFRELAGEDEPLHLGPLCELSPDDFSQREYRELLKMLYEGLAQEDLDLMTFIQMKLDPVLLEELDSILRADARRIRERVMYRFNGDQTQIFERQEHWRIGYGDVDTQVIARVLQLRARRLEREREDLRFRQEDADHDPADATNQAMMTQIMLSIRAKHIIDAELQTYQL